VGTLDPEANRASRPLPEAVRGVGSVLICHCEKRKRRSNRAGIRRAPAHHAVAQGRVRGADPGRQRGYLLFFAGARQSATRAARVEKCVPAISAGKGLHD
jgi:hypothetical protein